MPNRVLIACLLVLVVLAPAAMLGVGWWGSYGPVPWMVELGLLGVAAALGLAWWVLEFPFLRRHSQAYLKQHPEKRREDIDEARRACEKFALVPTSVMNFAEGTRFTRTKHADQRSPYKHLLKPKAGALGLALSVLGERFQSFVDVTIVYPDGAPTFWEFMCGRVPRIVVRAKLRTVPADFVSGDYESDSRFRKGLQRWLQEQWREKDALIDGVLGGPTPAEAQTNSPTIASPSR